MNYFPASPITAWPEDAPDGCLSIEDLIFECGLNLSAESAFMRSIAYRNGEPMVCLSCGRQTSADGGTHCGH